MIWDKVGEGGRQGGREGVKKKDMGESKGLGRGCGEGGVEVRICIPYPWPTFHYLNPYR
jgi:hypothetical protein